MEELGNLPNLQVPLLQLTDKATEVQQFLKEKEERVSLLEQIIETEKQKSTEH